MKKTLISAAVALLGVAALGAISPGGAVATPNDKVTICHATASETNPYTVNTVDESSIDEQNNRYLNGHGDHEGDIIPPFRTFPGQNWTTEGQAIWNNGCNVLRPPLPVEVVVVPPTMTPADCDVPGEVVVPEVTGLEYSTRTLGNGSVKVTVKAGEGYVLAAGSDTSWTFAAADLAQWAVDDPRCAEGPLPVEVVVVPPTMTPADCDAPGEVVVPEVTGLEYSTQTLGNGSVKVTVKAGEGFVLAADSDTSWTFAAADLAQWALDDLRCVESLPPVVTPPAVVVVPPGAVPPAVVTPAAATPTALPATGSVVWPIFLIGLTALAAGIGAVRLARRPV